MCCPLLYFTDGCKKSLPDTFCENNWVHRIMCSSLIFDSLAALTTLTLGILGLLSLIGIPPAASYASLATSGAICGLLLLALIHAQYFNDQPL